MQSTLFNSSGKSGNISAPKIDEVSPMEASPFNHAISKDNLRACQSEAFDATVLHYQEPGSERNCLIQLPTGTGKTAVIATLPFALKSKKTLVLTPNVKLAKDMADKLDILERGNIYEHISLLPEAVIKSVEFYTLRLESSAAAGDIEEHHLIVANYQQLQDLEKWFAGKSESIDLIVIDEAHHQAANTYRQIVEFFPNARVVGLTATPFRSDGKPIDGKPIYKYPFNRAIKDGVIRNLLASNVAPEQVELEFSDENKKAYTLEEVLEMKEESWFRRNIATSQDCCDSIARRAKEKLEELQRAFPNDSHQIIAAAMSKRHARENVKPAFEKLGLKVGFVSSDPQEKKTNDETFKKLEQGKIQVIVNIGMLGEGFDHPPLGVAAIFKPFLSLNPYIQFIGRVIRNNGSTKYSYIVSHLGLNQLQRFEEFKLFDNEDQEFLSDLLSGKTSFGSTGGDGDTSFVDTDKKDGGESKQETLMIRELGDQVLDFEAQFVPGQNVDRALSHFNSLDAMERELFLKKLGIDPSNVSVDIRQKDKRVKPSTRRKASQNLLNEREKSIVTDILKSLEVGFYGRDFNKLYPNFVWVKRRVSKELNKALGIERGKRKSITNEMFADMEARGLLNGIAEGCLGYFREKLKK